MNSEATTVMTIVDSTSGMLKIILDELETTKDSENLKAQGAYLVELGQHLMTAAYFADMAEF